MKAGLTKATLTEVAGGEATCRRQQEEWTYESRRAGRP